MRSIVAFIGSLAAFAVATIMFILAFQDVSHGIFNGATDDFGVHQAGASPRANNSSRYRREAVHGNCQGEEFKCNDASCIPKPQICNGNDDCDDGEDETLLLCARSTNRDKGGGSQTTPRFSADDSIQLLHDLLQQGNQNLEHLSWTSVGSKSPRDAVLLLGLEGAEKSRAIALITDTERMRGETDRGRKLSHLLLPQMVIDKQDPTTTIFNLPGLFSVEASSSLPNIEEGGGKPSPQIREILADFFIKKVLRRVDRVKLVLVVNYNSFLSPSSTSSFQANLIDLLNRTVSFMPPALDNRLLPGVGMIMVMTAAHLTPETFTTGKHLPAHHLQDMADFLTETRNQLSEPTSSISTTTTTARTNTTKTTTFGGSQLSGLKKLINTLTSGQFVQTPQNEKAPQKTFTRLSLLMDRAQSSKSDGSTGCSECSISARSMIWDHLQFAPITIGQFSKPNPNPMSSAAMELVEKYTKFLQTHLTRLAGLVGESMQKVYADRVRSTERGDTSQLITVIQQLLDDARILSKIAGSNDNPIKNIKVMLNSLKPSKPSQLHQVMTELLRHGEDFEILEQMTRDLRNSSNSSVVSWSWSAESLTPFNSTLIKVGEALQQLFIKLNDEVQDVSRQLGENLVDRYNRLFEQKSNNGDLEGALKMLTAADHPLQNLVTSLTSNDTSVNIRKPFTSLTFTLTLTLTLRSWGQLVCNALWAMQFDPIPPFLLKLRTLGLAPVPEDDVDPDHDPASIWGQFGQYPLKLQVRDWAKPLVAASAKISNLTDWTQSALFKSRLSLLEIPPWIECTMTSGDPSQIRIVAKGINIKVSRVLEVMNKNAYEKTNCPPFKSKQEGAGSEVNKKETPWSLSILALSSIIIDVDLHLPGFNLIFIAPNWLVGQERRRTNNSSIKINLDGLPGEDYEERATDGVRFPYQAPASGKAGRAGHNGGHFFGLSPSSDVSLRDNFRLLRISAKGGKGGKGQTGGFGYEGEPGPPGRTDCQGCEHTDEFLKKFVRYQKAIYFGTIFLHLNKDEYSVRYYSKSYGGIGKAGGEGASGGDGGPPGVGGSILLSSNIKNVDPEQSVQNFKMDVDGDIGVGGEGGFGGLAGVFGNTMHFCAGWSTNPKGSGGKISQGGEVLFRSSYSESSSGIPVSVYNNTRPCCETWVAPQCPQICANAEAGPNVPGNCLALLFWKPAEIKYNHKDRVNCCLDGRPGSKGRNYNNNNNKDISVGQK